MQFLSVPHNAPYVSPWFVIVIIIIDNGDMLNIS